MLNFTLWLYHSLFVCSMQDGCLGYVEVLVVMDIAAVSVTVYVSSQVHTLIYLGTSLGVAEM